MRIDMCAAMCRDVCRDMCTDMCTDMCIDMLRSVRLTPDNIAGLAGYAFGWLAAIRVVDSHLSRYCSKIPILNTRKRLL